MNMKKTIACLLIAVLLLCMTGCKPDGGAQTPVVLDLDGVMQEMLGLDALPEMMTLTQDDLLDYCGLEAQWCADCAACINANGYEKDEIILVRAADADSVPMIRDCLQTTLENAAVEMQNYLPEQHAMIQNCKVETRDLYVWLFISDQAEQMQSILESHFHAALA